MRKNPFPFIVFVILGLGTAFGKSFLTAEGFPKTFEDLSFITRSAIEAQGYEPFDTVFDADGRCVKNCPYYGITIQDWNNKLEQAAQEVANDVVETETVLDIGSHSIPTTCPIKSSVVRISSEMGQRNRRYHNGIDIAVSENTPVYAAADGRVFYRRIQGETKDAKQGYGVYLVLQHNKDYYTLYAHLNDWAVDPGQEVKAGDLIAYSGNTGHSTGPHLHYEVLKHGPLVNGEGGIPVDPRSITKCPYKPEQRS